ncbi:MAG: 50S ribosomal protein L19 [Candidatus Cloacimonetes bacterium]|nr:50S ribosomal protein L19 [Candidatus Cloacimonadota bacterium]MBS3767927.1 50S ribosomal protein L19 [Candidatus Cloacimonadota bacterium]
MELIDKIGNEGKKKDVPDFRAGDTVKVYYRFNEAGKTRKQIFQGIVIQKRGSGMNSTFTIRKISHRIGVEKIFPVHSPLIDEIEILSRGHTRKAKLFYLRDKKGKKGKVRQSKKRTLKAYKNKE